MLILSANPNPNPNLNPNLLSDSSTFLFPHKLATFHSSPKPRPLFTPRASSSSSSSSSSLQNTRALRHVSADGQASPEPAALDSSASAVAAAIRRASTSPVELSQRIQVDPPKAGLVLPSPDFQRLCSDQLDLFRRIVDPNALLSVYVRPAGSYVMDRLELRRVMAYPRGVNSGNVVILVGSFSIPAGLRAAEAVLSNIQVEFIPEFKAAVFPMVKHPFVVGFLVAEFRSMEFETPESILSRGCGLAMEANALPLDFDNKSWDIRPLEDEQLRVYNFTTEQRSSAINISRSLAMAYVMDQKAMLLQQSSWQNNVRMSKLIEQIRGPLSSIRTLSRLLSLQTKKGEIAYDIAEDVLIQGDHVRDTLEQLQDAVSLTKANIIRYNEENLKKMPSFAFAHPESSMPHLPNESTLDGSKSMFHNQADSLSINSSRDLELPMPPPQLAPLRLHNTRPCNVSDVLRDLVAAVIPLAHKQNRLIKLSELGQALQVAVEEPALRQAMSNLIEGALLRTRVGGNVEIVCMSAPAGGALVIIDDDGPDMHYMTQMHSLTPFGQDLCSDDMVEDNMTWNFVAGLTVAREILESYGCVVRVISPRTKDAALGAGGTRVEIWLPCFSSLPDFDSPAQVL